MEVMRETKFESDPTFCPLTPIWQTPQRKVKLAVSVNFLSLKLDQINKANKQSHFQIATISPIAYSHHQSQLKIFLKVAIILYIED